MNLGSARRSTGMRRSTIFSAQWRGGASVPLRSSTSCSPQVSQANTSRVPSSCTSTGGPVGPLVTELQLRGGRYGLQVMCEGGGMANATILERLDG